jgi:hypothetical protein
MVCRPWDRDSRLSFSMIGRLKPECERIPQTDVQIQNCPRAMRRRLNAGEKVRQYAGAKTHQKRHEKACTKMQSGKRKRLEKLKSNSSNSTGYWRFVRPTKSNRPSKQSSPPSPLSSNDSAANNKPLRHNSRNSLALNAGAARLLSRMRPVQGDTARLQSVGHMGRWSRPLGCNPSTCPPNCSHWSGSRTLNPR